MTTRKYFGTDGIRGKYGQSDINPEFVLKLGWAIGRVLVNGRRKKVLIGKDTRISGYLLESALQAGLSAAGVDIHLLGPMPTPAIAYLTRTFRAQAGIMISASHNPYYDNGIKFFGANGRKLDDAVEAEIEAMIDKPLVSVDSADLGKAVRINDAPGRYIEFCKSTISSSVRFFGLKIVLDCANGAAYHVAPDVFTELGADVITLADEPDGFNINADCGSTATANLQQRVLDVQADIGIALDGDGDRVIMVDHNGEVVDGDELLFVIAAHRFTQPGMMGGVVGTQMSNFGLEQRFKELNIPFTRSQVGDRYVMAELQRRDWLLGGESSGHIICMDKTPTGDGIISALQVLFSMHHSGKSLYELKSDMQKLPQTLINVQASDASRIMQAPDLEKAIKASEQKLNGNGRVLLRPSGTEPLIRVMVEGQDPHLAKEVAKDLATTVQALAANL